MTSIRVYMSFLLLVLLFIIGLKHMQELVYVILGIRLSMKVYSHYSSVSRSHSVPCHSWPWPRMARAASSPKPSIAHPGLCRLDLDGTGMINRHFDVATGGVIPKLIPGFSSLTLSRCSFAKNMYAERPRLGALGSARCMVSGDHNIW